MSSESGCKVHFICILSLLKCFQEIGPSSRMNLSTNRKQLCTCYTCLVYRDTSYLNMSVIRAVLATLQPDNATPRACHVKLIDRRLSNTLAANTEVHRLNVLSVCLWLSFLIFELSQLQVKNNLLSTGQLFLLTSEIKVILIFFHFDLRLGLKMPIFPSIFKLIQIKKQ